MTPQTLWSAFSHLSPPLSLSVHVPAECAGVHGNGWYVWNALKVTADGRVCSISPGMMLRHCHHIPREAFFFFVIVMVLIPQNSFDLRPLTMCLVLRVKRGFSFMFQPSVIIMFIYLNQHFFPIMFSSSLMSAAFNMSGVEWWASDDVMLHAVCAGNECSHSTVVSNLHLDPSDHDVISSSTYEYLFLIMNTMLFFFW